MQQGWSEFVQALGMQGGTIPFVLMKTIVRVQVMIKHHQHIAHHFGDNGRAGDHVTALIAMDNRPRGDGRRRRMEPIDENPIRGCGKVTERVLHGEERRGENIVLVNLLGADDPDADFGLLENDPESLEALPRG